MAQISLSCLQIEKDAKGVVPHKMAHVSVKVLLGGPDFLPDKMPNCLKTSAKKQMLIVIKEPVEVSPGYLADVLST